MPNHIPMQSLIAPAVSFMAQRFGIAGGKGPAVMIGAIGDQESGWASRDQLEVQNGRLVPGAIGPATGYGQFEKNGAVAGVMTHPASKAIAAWFIERAGLPFDKDAVWRSFVTVGGDELHMVFMRLLLLTDPQPIPAPDFASEETAFQYYLRNWRPGAWFNNDEGSTKRLELRARWTRARASALQAASEVDWEAAPTETPATPPESSAADLIAEIRERLDLLERTIG